MEKRMSDITTKEITYFILCVAILCAPLLQIIFG